MTLSEQQLAEAVEAMARANYGFVGGTGKNLHEALLDAALPVIERAALQEAIEAVEARKYGGHCGETTAEKISRQRYNNAIDDAAEAIRALADEVKG